MFVLGALKKWEIWTLGIKNALPQADGFQRDVFPRFPAARGPRGAHRIWDLQARAYYLNDAPVAFRKTRQRFFSRSKDSLALVLKFQVSSFGHCLRLGPRRSGGAAGAITKHIDAVLVCGEPDIEWTARQYV